MKANRNGRFLTNAHKLLNTTCQVVILRTYVFDQPMNYDA